MVGKPIRNVDASSEYYELASTDERVGLMLMEKGEHRHSILLLIQAMEKYTRAKIFSIIDAKNQHFREDERDHDFVKALKKLVLILSKKDAFLGEQVQKQIDNYVVGDIKFNHLHNNLRYPYYSERFNTYSAMQYNRADNEVIAQRLVALKQFLEGIDRFR